MSGWGEAAIAAGGAAGTDLTMGLASANQARLNRGFNKWLATSQYQRAVADMRAAGLNPILAATGGMSEASPGASGGSMPSMENPGAAAVTAKQLSMAEQQQRIAERGVSVQEQLADAEVEKKRAEVVALGQSTAAAVSEAMARKELLEQQALTLAPLNESQKQLNDTTARKLKSEMPKQETMGKVYGLGGRVVDTVSPVVKWLTTPNATIDKGIKGLQGVYKSVSDWFGEGGNGAVDGGSHSAKAHQERMEKARSHSFDKRGF